MIFESPIYKKKLVSHYFKNWKSKEREIYFSKGPVGDLPEGFSILEYAPSAHRKMWTYATCCMSQESDEYPIELHMFSPRKSEEVVEILVMTAHYHRTGGRLGLGHSVNFGRPWIDGSKCEYGLISLPYLDGQKLENMFSPEMKCTKFYWLIPITRQEVAYKKTHGVEGLEEKFEEKKFNYVDPLRASVC